MSGLTLYLRSRRTSMALSATVGCAALRWTLGLLASDTRDVDGQLVVLTILLLVIALTVTLGSPDGDLDKTAARPLSPRRGAHLLAVSAVIIVLLLLTSATAARFGPAWLAVRDAAGLVGLTALCAATLGAHRAWFLPLGWTLAAVLFPQSGSLPGRILTWQTQDPASRAAAVTATALALTGLVSYAWTGPARSNPAEAAQQ
jgi:hypothetical protein